MSYLVLVVLVFLGLLIVGNVYFTASMDSAEPPLAPTNIPIIGHVIGLSKRKFDYYIDLSQKLRSPIFTMLLPGQKMYVVVEPDLVQMVQKQHKNLPFTPIESKFSTALFHPSQTSVDLLNNHMSEDEGVHVDTRIAMRDGTAPGPEVDQMNRQMIREVSNFLDRLAPSKSETKTIDLFAWLKETLSIATTNSVYGEHNPYKDVKIRNAFWEFEQGLMKIILLPKLLARNPIAARTKISNAFNSYYANNYHETAALVTRNRWNTATKHGIPREDIAKFEVGAAIAFLVNTVPATFWFLYHIYSHPDLLSLIRSEIDAVTRTTHTNTHTVPTHSLDITSLKSSCPVLLSTYRETLRHHAMGMTVRAVATDTLLAGRYLLKSGAMIQMPTRVIHTDPSIWGDDVGEFRPRRFLKGEKHRTLNGESPKDMYFRAFGGGKTLCPGRHFATNEVIALTACFVARFEMTPKSGRWEMPSSYSTSVAAAVMVPDSDIEVDIKARSGKDGEWRISLTDSELVLGLTAEDVA